MCQTKREQMYFFVRRCMRVCYMCRKYSVCDQFRKKNFSEIFSLKVLYTNKALLNTLSDKVFLLSNEMNSKSS